VTLIITSSGVKTSFSSQLAAVLLKPFLMVIETLLLPKSTIINVARA